MSDLALNQDLHEKVLDKIKTSFMELIPDMAWDNLVKTQVDSFIEKDLKILIKEELALKFRAEIKAVLESPEFETMSWGEHGPSPSEAIKQIIKELIPDFASAIIGGIVQNAVMNMRSQLGQNMY